MEAIISENEVAEESRRTGENEHAVRRRMEMAASPNAPRAVLKARQTLEAAEEDFQSAVQAESDRDIAVRNLESDIRETAYDVGNGETLLAAAKEFCEAFEVGFDNWSDVIRTSPIGEQALGNGETMYAAMQVRLKFMPASLERKRAQLRDLQAQLAKLKSDAAKK